MLKNMQFEWEIVALSPVAYITVDLKKVVSRAISRRFHAGSTLVESKSPCIMSVQYTRGCAVQWGMFSKPGRNHEYSGGYHEYTAGCSVHWGVSWVHRGDIMVNVWEGHWQNNWICMETPVYWTSPGVLMISPTLIKAFRQCSHGIPLVYSWYPLVYWTVLAVLMISRHSSWYPLLYS